MKATIASATKIHRSVRTNEHFRTKEIEDSVWIRSECNLADAVIEEVKNFTLDAVLGAGPLSHPIGQGIVGTWKVFRSDIYEHLAKVKRDEWQNIGRCYGLRDLHTFLQRRLLSNANSKILRCLQHRDNGGMNYKDRITTRVIQNRNRSCKYKSGIKEVEDM